MLWVAELLSTQTVCGTTMWEFFMKGIYYVDVNQNILSSCHISPSQNVKMLSLTVIIIAFDNYIQFQWISYEIWIVL